MTYDEACQWVAVLMKDRGLDLFKDGASRRLVAAMMDFPSLKCMRSGEYDKVEALFDGEMKRGERSAVHYRWFRKYRAPMRTPVEAFRIDLTPWAAFV